MNRFSLTSVLAILLTLWMSSEALKCYFCSNCENASDYDDSKLDDKIGGQECKACTKTTVTSWVTRGCVPAATGIECKSRANGTNSDEGSDLYCECTTDKCNSAPPTLQTSLTPLALGVSSVIYLGSH